MEPVQKIGFFEEKPGQKSSGRLNVFILLIASLVLGGLTLAAGLYKYIECTNGESLPVVATAAGGLIVTISGVALSYKAYSKEQENRSN